MNNQLIKESRKKENTNSSKTFICRACKNEADVEDSRLIGFAGDNFKSLICWKCYDRAMRR